jgi:hypothetical protein
LQYRHILAYKPPLSFFFEKIRTGPKYAVFLFRLIIKTSNAIWGGPAADAIFFLLLYTNIGGHTWVEYNRCCSTGPFYHPLATSVMCESAIRTSNGISLFGGRGPKVWGKKSPPYTQFIHHYGAFGKNLPEHVFLATCTVSVVSGNVGHSVC